MLLREIAILYASQTGNTEFIANQIRESIVHNGFTPFLYNFNDYFKKENFNRHTLYVLVHATTGDGDPPDNATKFWKFLRKLSKEQLLVFKELNYAIIGWITFIIHNHFKGLEIQRMIISISQRNYLIRCWRRWVPLKFTGLSLLTIQLSSFLFNFIILTRYSQDSEVISWIESLILILPSLVQFKLKDIDLQIDLINSSKDYDNKKSILIETQKLSIESELNPHVVFEIYPHEYETIKQLTGIPKYIPSLMILTHVSTRQTDLTHFYPFETTRTMNWETTVDKPFISSIISSKTLTGSKSIQRVIQVKLDVGHEWQWESGDAIGIISPNNDTLVLSTCERLNIPPEHQYVTCGSNPKSFYLTLKWNLDLLSFPKKSFFRCMAEFADDLDKRKLLYLISIQGARTFKRMREEKLSVLDILKSFPSVKIPFEVLLDNLLKLQPRYYSIASSNLSSKSSICIGFGIVDYPFMNRLFNGLCSGYIDSIMSLPDAQLAIFPKSRGLVTLSQRKKVIMICTGTGVTPFMSLIEDNRIRYEKERSNGNVLEKQSKMWLFYGCRFRGNEGDMLYRKELENAKEIGVLQELTVAYSRDEKEYIQDKMNMNRGMLVEWMKDGASIYVCGGLGMSKDVHSTLMSIFDDGEQNVSEYMQQLVNENRYVREIWG